MSAYSLSIMVMSLTYALMFTCRCNCVAFHRSCLTEVDELTLPLFSHPTDWVLSTRLCMWSRGGIWGDEICRCDI